MLWLTIVSLCIEFSDAECIPAAAIKINSHQIICPRHMDLESKPRTVLCQICCKRKDYFYLQS